MRGATLTEHQKPMKEVVKRLENELGFSLSKAASIELFAREGDWQAVSYASHVKTMEAWD